MPTFRVPPIVRRFGLVSFLTDAASEMIYPLLPALLRSFGAASVWLGAMEGVAEALSAAVKWRMGPVTDRAARKKPFVVAGYSVATFARPIIAFAGAGWQVVALRTLDRIGKGIRSVPRDALLAESVPKERWATSFAFHRAMDNAGSVLGPILAFALLRFLSLRTRVVVFLAIVPGILSLLVLIFGVREPPREPTHATETEAASTGLPAPARRYLAVLALFTLGASADSFLLLRAVDLGLKEEWTPLLWLALSASKALSNVPGGRLADRFGRRPVLVAAWLVYAVAYAALGAVHDVRVYAAVVIAYGIHYGLAEGTEKALLAERTRPAERGRAFAAMHALTGLAVLPANLLFGGLYRVSAVAAFTTSAAIAAVAAALLASARTPGTGSPASP
jgi:MFS family permease